MRTAGLTVSGGRPAAALTSSAGTALLTAAQVDELFKENLYLVVQTAGGAAVRGRVLTHLAGPAEAAGRAVMLRGAGGSVAGLAWASLDTSCRLHYSTRLEGPDSLETAAAELELEDYPIQVQSTLQCTVYCTVLNTDGRQPEVSSAVPEHAAAAAGLPGQQVFRPRGQSAQADGGAAGQRRRGPPPLQYRPHSLRSQGTADHHLASTVRTAHRYSEIMLVLNLITE